METSITELSTPVVVRYVMVWLGRASVKEASTVPEAILRISRGELGMVCVSALSVIEKLASCAGFVIVMATPPAAIRRLSAASIAILLGAKIAYVYGLVSEALVALGRS